MDHLETLKKYFQNSEQFEFILKADEIELLSGLNELLEMFTMFTKIIQGDKYPCLNYHVLLYTTIEDRLMTLMTFNENEVILSAAEVLYNNLVKRIGLFTESMAAAILDPMFQNLPLIDTWIEGHEIYQTRLDVIEAVLNEFGIEINQPNEGTGTKSIDTPMDRNSNYILSLVEKYTQSSNNGSITLNTDLKSELQRFRCIQDHPHDLMKFWTVIVFQNYAPFLM